MKKGEVQAQTASGLKASVGQAMPGQRGKNPHLTQTYLQAGSPIQYNI